MYGSKSKEDMGIPEKEGKTSEGRRLLPFAGEVFPEDVMASANGLKVFSGLSGIRQLTVVSIIVGQPACHGAFCKGFR